MSKIIDFNAARPPGEIVLRLDDVTVEAGDDYDVGLSGASLTLRAGELALVLLEQGAQDHPLDDVISGLVLVTSGAMEIFGGAWSDWNPDQQARARGRIGRVFARQSWLNNLDVDENVTLAERHHTRRAESEIYDEAQRLAALAGLETLPHTRPSVTDREDLRRAEWVRAALGSPWLMLLERPGKDLAPGWRHHLKPLVRAARERGAAVLWLCEDEDEWLDESLTPTLKLRAEGNTLKA